MSALKDLSLVDQPPAAAAAATAAATPPYFVRVGLSTAVEEYFIKLHCHSSSAVGVVAALATQKWGGSVRLLLIARAGEPKPQQPAFTAALQAPQWLPEEATWESLGVASGAWLLAVRSSPASLSEGGSMGALLALLEKRGALLERLEALQERREVERKAEIAERKAEAALLKVERKAENAERRAEAAWTLSTLTSIQAVLASLVQQLQIRECVFSAAPSSPVAKLRMPRRLGEGTRELPSMAHLMPQAGLLKPFVWGAGMWGVTAAPRLQRLLGSWLGTGPAPQPTNELLDVQTLAGQQSLVVRDPGVGSFKGVADLAILCHGMSANVACPLNACAAIVDWKTPGALAGQVRPQAFLQTLGMNAFAADCRSPPLFITDLATHFVCCFLEGESVCFYEGAAGTQYLSLAEGIGLLQHFLQLDRERQVARLASAGTVAVGEEGGGGGGLQALPPWDSDPVCGATGSSDLAELQAQHIAELQSISMALTHELPLILGVSRTFFCMQGEEEGDEWEWEGVGEREGEEEGQGVGEG